MSKTMTFVLIVVLLAGCSINPNQPVEVEPKLPTSSATALTAPPSAPTDQPAPAAEWAALEAGVDFREIATQITNVQVIRIDPTVFRVRVAYDAGDPGRVSEWAGAIEPLALINGGYFDDQGRATALTIYDGVSAGSSYEGFGGMLAVDTNGILMLRSLHDQPYDSDEPLAQALQSTPMLVLNGSAVPQVSDDGDRARRSVVAIDEAGRLLLIVCAWPAFTLSELSRWLVDQQLGILNALNLDGGSSTGLALNTAARSFVIDSLVRVPQVLVIERR